MTATIETREQARDYFISKGLNYQDINLVQFLALNEFIKEELDNHKIFKMQLSKQKKVNSLIDSIGLLEGYIYVDGDYFKKREAISFNEDGFIGFAGWADSGNVQPFIKAFVKWTDTLYKKGEVDYQTLRDVTIRDIAINRLRLCKRCANTFTKEMLIYFIKGQMTTKNGGKINDKKKIE